MVRALQLIQFSHQRHTGYYYYLPFTGEGTQKVENSNEQSDFTAWGACSLMKGKEDVCSSGDRTVMRGRIHFLIFKWKVYRVDCLCGTLTWCLRGRFHKRLFTQVWERLRETHTGGVGLWASRMGLYDLRPERVGGS